MPENLILFGVLTLIGSCMLLMAGCRNVLQKIPAVPGMLFSFSLFAFTKHTNDGFLGIFNHELTALPEFLYRNYLTAYLGFPQKGFMFLRGIRLLPPRAGIIAIRVISVFPTKTNCYRHQENYCPDDI